MENSDNMIEKNKRIMHNLIIYFSIIMYAFVYKFFVYEKMLKYNEAITSSFLLLLLFLAIWFYGFRKKVNAKYSKPFVIIVLFFTVLYFILTYGIGFATSFLKNSYSLKPLSIFNNIVFLIITIISEELLRFVFIKANKNSKKDIVFVTFLLIILDVFLNVRFDSLTDNYLIFDIISAVIIPSIIKNIMCSYAVYYADYKAPIVYRLITELYMFIVPIQPDLNDYINSMCLLLLPFLIIISMSRQTDENISNKSKSRKKIIKKTDIPFIVIGLLVYCLICGYGPYKLIGIETGSMTPRLNIGDAVIISKNFDVDKLKEGDIVAYKNKDNDLIVHRIIKVNNDQTFITKGDYNNVADRDYVNKEQIKGKVILKIPYIAYPAIMFR